jgi:PAS domain S-box-containing protein
MRHGVLAVPTDLGQRPSSAQLRHVVGILVAMALLFAVLAPVAGTPLPAAPQFIPMVQSVLVGANLLTGILLLGHVHSGRSPAFAILALGYLFTALIAAAHMLSFPGLFALQGVLGGNRQSTSWLHIAWHAACPLFVLGFVLCARSVGGSGGRRSASLPPRFMRIGALLTTLLATALVLGVTRGASHLPALVDATHTLPLYRAIAGALLALTVCVLWATARKQPRTALDVWLMVALAAWVFELGLSGLFSDDLYDLGFYVGRLYGLAAALFVLGALAVDNIALHARLHATFQEMAETRAQAQWQSLLGSVLRQLPDGVLIVDHAGRCVMANDQACRIAQRFSHAGHAGPRSGGEGDGVAAMLELIGEPVARARGGAAFREALLESAQGGARRVYTVNGAPLRDGAAELAAAVIVLDDITERTEASAALGRALEQTRYLIENTPLAVIEWNREMTVTLWNRRAEELFGWRADEVLGARIDALPIIHQDDADQVNAMIRRLLGSGTRYAKSSNRNLSRDGSALCCEWYNSVLVDEQGEILTVFSLVLDVSEREQAMERLREADRRKDVYIATLAHELRNPLAPIANAACLLRSKTLPPDRIEWIAAMVARQSAQMARLLDDLLDVSRIGRGKIVLRRTRLELGRLLRDTLQACMPLIEAARHQVRLRLADEPLWVEADALRLTQVFANLINNAAKYTPPGGSIELGLRSDDGQALAWVADNGVGLDASMIERIFDPFVQVGSASHMAQGGLGIGLSLAKGLVELHDGSIRADSAGPGQGARLTVSLPLCAAAEVAPTMDSGLADGAAAGLGVGIGKHILVADDNIDAAESLAWLLRAQGATVTVAHDGAQALRFYHERRAEIAVLDLGMPEMSGLEVAAILAQTRPRPYLVAVTGRARQEDRAASLAAGFDQHFTKPLAPQQLIELLRTVRV